MRSDKHMNMKKSSSNHSSELDSNCCLKWPLKLDLRVFDHRVARAAQLGGWPRRTGVDVVYEVYSSHNQPWLLAEAIKHAMPIAIGFRKLICSRSA